jgi:hypothetical protein
MKYLRILEHYLNYWIKLLVIFLVLMVLTPSLLCNGGNLMDIELKYPTYYEMIQKRKAYIEQQEFEYGLMLEYIELLNINNKYIIVSQSILETNTFTSDIFTENNNLFGMKEPSVRPTTANGTNRGHAEYEHWTYSIKDYKLWYDYMTRNEVYYNYYAFLTRIGYAEDEEYILKLRNIERSLI